MNPLYVEKKFIVGQRPGPYMYGGRQINLEDYVTCTPDQGLYVYNGPPQPVADKQFQPPPKKPTRKDKIVAECGRLGICTLNNKGKVKTIKLLMEDLQQYQNQKYNKV